MIDNQRHVSWHPNKPPDQQVALWKLAWVAVGMVVFFAIMFGIELLWS